MLIPGRWWTISGIREGGGMGSGRAFWGCLGGGLLVFSGGAGARPRVCYNSAPAGEMDERFKSHAWKACIG
jgi:hypothetical protein